MEIMPGAALLPKTANDTLDLSESMVVEVKGEDITPEEHAKVAVWTLVGKRAGQPVLDESKKTKDRKAYQELRRKGSNGRHKGSRYAKHPSKEEIKVITRPRGGLIIARTPPPAILKSIWWAARLTKTEGERGTFCPNSEQNIMVISTPDEKRATRYAMIRTINVDNQEYAVGVYQTAPEWTTKGVIRGIRIEYIPEEIYQSIVTQRNQTARGAKG